MDDLVVLSVLGAVLAFLGCVAWLLRREKGGSFLRFIGRYVALSATLVLAEVAVGWLFPSFHEMLCGVTANLVGDILRLAYPDTRVAGVVVGRAGPAPAYDITLACLGSLLLWTYLGLVFASKSATPGQRIRGAIVGLAALLVFNVLRIALSMYIDWTTGVYVHDLFYVVNVAVVVFVWWMWQRGASAVVLSHPS